MLSLGSSVGALNLAGTHALTLPYCEGNQQDWISDTSCVTGTSLATLWL